MKHTIAISTLVFMILCIISCKKDTTVTKDTTATIVAKWNVVNDSTFLEGNGIFQGGSSKYTGVATDYFDFNSNGYLYEKEGIYLDMAKYSLTSDKQVKLRYYTLNGIGFGSTGAIAGPFNITVLTEHNLTLTLSALTPEGEEFEIINLKR
jgi:hypothetical protein